MWIVDKEYLKPGLAEWMCTYVFVQGSALIKAPHLIQYSVIAVLEFLMILNKGTHIFILHWAIILRILAISHYVAGPT